MTNYERALDKFLDQIFSHFQGLTLEDIAKKSKLSVSTVWKIDTRWTKLPRFKTIFQLARAAGLEIEFRGITKLKLRA